MLSKTLSTCHLLIASFALLCGSAGCGSGSNNPDDDAVGGSSAGGGLVSGGGGTGAVGGGVAAGGAPSAGGGAQGGSGGVPDPAAGGTGSPGAGGEIVGTGAMASTGGSEGTDLGPSPRSRVKLSTDWKFTKGDPAGVSGLSYAQNKQWVLPTGNRFLADPNDWAARPAGNLAADVSYVSATFDDSSWGSVTVPHDYAIQGPFTDAVSSSMGRLPSPGIAWYRKSFDLSAEAAEQSVFLDIDGAMQYSMVWVNGQFVGGWPYGYASYRLDLSEYVVPGAENQIALRVETPQPASSSWDAGSSRWYPGGGLYRNVWLVVSDRVHVAQWGTYVTTPEISDTSASVNLEITVDNDGDQEADLTITTEIYELDEHGARVGQPVAELAPVDLIVAPGDSAVVDSTGTIENPRLWGVAPTQTPHLYQAVTFVRSGSDVLDRYETQFGVRTIEMDGNGFRLNGESMQIEGVCLHHDLGALGAAAHTRARERQFEIMQEMGANGIRTSHNPMEPELYDLADRMGMLVMDEAFDVWAEGKAAQDHHVFFEDWHEQDLRALIRRDRNHPSVFIWSIGNEVVEQFDNSAGPAWAQTLTAISHEEDPTRPTVAGMNKAEPDSPFSVPIDTVGLNYQGTGVRDLGAQYPTYHAAFPDKFIIGTETVSTFSTRGTYLFPVTSERGVPTNGTTGGDAQRGIISSYDLYHADWSVAPDEEFESQEKWPYVGGEFVWTGFDYIGEPTPLDAVARSSYFGIVDLAGLKKDRFYFYQARWRSELPMAHILPHWTWPERVGQTTPVHIYTSGDEAELFLNGVSLGRKQKGQYEYRLRFDDVQYEAGELSVVAYKGGQEWATDSVETAGDAAGLELNADRSDLNPSGEDLAFITVQVVDAEGRLAPRAENEVTFQVSGPGEILATDNGDPTDRQVFPSPKRKAFSGKAIVIVRAIAGQSGEITVSASAAGLSAASVVLTIQ